jgi:hypothetical protein
VPGAGFEGAAARTARESAPESEGRESAITAHHDAPEGIGRIETDDSEGTDSKLAMVDPVALLRVAHVTRIAVPDRAGALWQALGDALELGNLDEARSLYDLLARRAALTAKEG